VRFLTPILGPNSSAIAIRSQSTCRAEALPTARLTCNVGGLHRELEHLIAAPDPIDLAPLATLAETVIAVGMRCEACRSADFARSLQIARGSRR
jgi:hypothetical protein